jgi:hypothetical protein
MARVEVAGTAVPSRTRTSTDASFRPASSSAAASRPASCCSTLDTRAPRSSRAPRSRPSAQGVVGELTALAGEHAALAAAIEVFESGGRTRHSEASASVQEAEIAAAYARSLAERSDNLRELGVESSEAAEVLQARERGTAAIAAIRRVQVARTRSRAVRAARHVARRARPHRPPGGRAAARARGPRRRARRARPPASLEHTMRAPIAGTLGGVVPLQPGGVLTRGTVVAVVIPDDRLRVVARFTPASVGRIRPGQPFRLRLDGFPWTEFGSLVGAVGAIASETQDSLVRVECELDAHQGARIPVEHGLVGVVEVTVETVSPASLLLRTVGQLLAP